MKVIVRGYIHDDWKVGDGVEILDMVWLKQLVADGKVELLEPMPEEPKPEPIVKPVKKTRQRRK